MRARAFAGRNLKEMLRDPMTLMFGMALPVALLLIMSLIARSAPVELFKVGSLAPAIGVFSYSFITLFAALLMAKDRSTAFIVRLYASPMTAADFLLGYGLPLLPLGLLQGIVCYAAGIAMGLEVSWGIVVSLGMLVIVSVMYSGFGMLLGAAFSDKQVGGIFSVFVNLSTWLSGTWFDLELVGGAFKTIADIFPFSHAVTACRLACAGEYSATAGHILYVLLWAAGDFLAAALVFRNKMKKN